MKIGKRTEPDTAIGKLGKVFKNIPIPIIKHCTGIHPESLSHCAAFLNPARVVHDEFSINDPNNTGCWIATNYATGSPSAILHPERARGYPLYKPQSGTGRPDSLKLTLEITTESGVTGGSGVPTGAPATALENQLDNTHLLVIVTYMKMDLEDIDF